MNIDIYYRSTKHAWAQWEPIRNGGCLLLRWQKQDGRVRRDIISIHGSTFHKLHIRWLLHLSVIFVCLTYSISMRINFIHDSGPPAGWAPCKQMSFSTKWLSIDAQPAHRYHATESKTNHRSPVVFFFFNYNLMLDHYKNTGILWDRKRSNIPCRLGVLFEIEKFICAVWVKVSVCS